MKKANSKNATKVETQAIIGSVFVNPTTMPEQVKLVMAREGVEFNPPKPKKSLTECVQQDLDYHISIGEHVDIEASAKKHGYTEDEIAETLDKLTRERF